MDVLAASSLKSHLALARIIDSINLIALLMKNLINSIST